MFKFTKTGSISGAGSPNYLDGAYDIAIHTITSVKYAFVASFRDDSLCIFNVNDPANPTFVVRIGSLDGIAKVRTFEDGGNVYAVATLYNSASLKVIDVTTPATPSVVGTLSGTGSPNYLDGAYGLFLQVIGATQYAFVTSITDNKLVIVDLSTPATPSLTAAIGGSGAPNYCDAAHDVYVVEISSNWYAFVVSQDDNSLSVFDVETPGSPSLVDSIQTLNGAHSITGQGNYVYVSSTTDNSISVVDVSNPASVSIVGSVSGTGKPNYLYKAMGVAYRELQSMKFLFVCAYAEDGITAINVDTPASPRTEGKIIGAGIPNYLDGIHGIAVDDDYAYTVSYMDNSLIIFAMDPSDTSALSATIAIESDAHCTLTQNAEKSLSATIAIESDAHCTLTGGDDWGDVIGKPYWQPCRRAYIQDSDGLWIDITDRVAEFGTINWQVEEEYHFNVFTANNCKITLKNEDEEFDVDNEANYFLSIGQRADGYRVPIRIACGYLIDGVESLMNVFHGLIIDVDTTTDHDKASIDLQCVSRILRDAKCEDIGYHCKKVALNGGETYAEITNPVGIATTFIKATIKKGSFADAGYAKLVQYDPNDDTKIEYSETFYYGQKTDYGFAYCIRGVGNTEINIFSVGMKIFGLLANGQETDDRYFQFPVFPIVKDSVENVTSSDGNITIVNDRDVVLGLSTADRKLLGYIDYENGLLELGDKPTDSSSIQADFIASLRMASFHGLIKQLVEDEGLETTEIKDCELSDRNGNEISYIYGRISVAESDDGEGVIMPNTPCLALATSDDYVYLGAGSYLIQWDGERWRAKANVGSDKIIVRLGVSSEGYVFGIAKPNNSDGYGYVFKYDGHELTFLTGAIAAYLNLDDGLEGAQNKGFSVDDDNDVVWFLYSDSVG